MENSDGLRNGFGGYDQLPLSPGFNRLGGFFPVRGIGRQLAAPDCASLGALTVPGFGTSSAVLTFQWRKVWKRVDRRPGTHEALPVRALMARPGAGKLNDSLAELRESQPRRNGGESGFTLLETLLALGLSVILGTALLSLTLEFAAFQGVYSVLIRGGEGLLSAAGLLNRFAAGAGNRLPSTQGVLIAADGLLIRSDQDGADGFPDDDVGDPFESIDIRVNQERFQMRSGSGGYQTLLEGIAGLELTRPAPRLLSVNVSVVTEVVPGIVQAVGGAEFTFDLLLWNYRPLLFPRETGGGGDP